MRPPWESFLPRPLFDPVTIALVGFSALGTLASAGAQAQQGEVAAATGRYNQQIYEQQAQTSIAEANAKADIQRRENARRLGQVAGAYGASGVDVGQGTPLDVLSDQAAEGELQTRLILYGGQQQAAALRQRGAMALWTGQQGQAAGQTAAATTLMTGALRTGFAGYNLMSGGGKVPVQDPTGNFY